MDLSRNHYDRVGHFAQGFVPAIVAREILLRTSPLRPGGWLFVLVAAVCLAVSACYELFEWAAALVFGQRADAFLGTQGRRVGYAMGYVSGTAQRAECPVAADWHA